MCILWGLFEHPPERAGHWCTSVRSCKDLAFISISQKKKAIDKDMNHPFVAGPGVTAKVCQVCIPIRIQFYSLIALYDRQAQIKKCREKSS